MNLSELRQIRAEIDQRLGALEQRITSGQSAPLRNQIANAGSNVDDLRAKYQAAKDKLDALEQAQNRAAVVNPLPVNAPRGILLVTPGDINLYVGTGPNTPLRKIPTAAV